MKKKLQVFVSSTYTDLLPERQAAVEAILNAGHIPAGMELFAAQNRSQMDVIEKWIRESDVYMLIVGARYGSIEPDSKKSYTQLEFEYAVKLGKPSFAVVLDDETCRTRLDELSAKHGASYRESNATLAELDKFKAVVMRTLVKKVNSTDGVQLAVFQSIPTLEQEHVLVGWVRGDQADMSLLPQIVAELSQVRADKEKLKLELEAGRSRHDIPEISDLADMDDKVTVPLHYWNYDGEHGPIQMKLSWAELFSLIGPFVSSGASTTAEVAGYLEQQLLEKLAKPSNGFRSVDLREDFAGTLHIQLTLYSLIETKENGGIWSLTPTGKRKLMELRAVRK